MRVAICSSNGTDVDLHFGKTSMFYIYDLDKGVFTYSEKRMVEKYSPTDEFLEDSKPQHGFNSIKFGDVLGTIEDCEKVYTVNIGAVPKKKLEDEGIKVQMCSCPIESIKTCDGKCK